MSGPWSPEADAVRQYWNRASFALLQAEREDIPAEARAMFTAFCCHACQSLKEAIDHVREMQDELGVNLPKAASQPYEKLVERMRNLDLHGRPIPACERGVDFQLSVSGRDPARLTSSDSVCISVQFACRPKVTRAPKDQSKANFTPGDGLTYVGKDGKLMVSDPASGRAVDALAALREHLLSFEEVLPALMGGRSEPGTSGGVEGISD